MIRSSGGINNIQQFQRSRWSKLGYHGRGKYAIKNGSAYVHYLQQHYQSSGLKQIKDYRADPTKDFSAFGTQADDNFKQFLKDPGKLQSNKALKEYGNAMKKKLNNNAINLFAKAVDDNLLKKIDQAFGKAFKEIVNFNRGTALEKYQEMGSLSERLKKLDALLDPKKTEEAFTEFAGFLNDINVIVELMERSARGSSESQLVFVHYLKSVLSTAVETVTNAESKTIQDFLVTIRKQLQKENESVRIIKNSQYQQALNYYINFIDSLISFSNKEKRSFSQVMENLQQQFISTGLGEATAFMQEQCVLQAQEKTFKDFMTGTKTVSNKFGKNSTVTRKTDIKIKDQKVTLEIDGKKHEIKADLDLSVKFYKTNVYQVSASKPGVMTFESGSGGSLKEFFAAIGLQQQQEYNIYNYLTFMGLTDEFKNLILKRQFFRLFSTAANKSSNIDFSSYLLVNGELISVYSLFRFMQEQFNKENDGYIKNCIKLYLQRSGGKGAKSLSSKKTIKENENWMFLNQWESSNEYMSQIKMSTKTKKFIPAARGDQAISRANLSLAWKRAKIMVNDINSATIHATIHLHKIIQAFSSNQSEIQVNAYTPK